MRKTLITLVLLFSATASSLALGDIVQMPEDGGGSRPASLPRKGMTMQVVLNRFGQPQKKYAPVGGDTRKHPPITRWDYPGYSVFFERTHVVDDVVPGAPAEVYHADQLSPAG